MTRELPGASPTRALRAIHGALVGYGYRTSLAFVWLLLAIIASTCILHWHGGFLVEKAISGGDAQAFHANLVPWSDSAGITLDNLLPFASLGIKDQWLVRPGSPYEWSWLLLFLGLKFGAWGLAALALASITGVIRKPH